MKRIEPLLAGSCPALSSRKKHPPRRNHFFYRFEQSFIQDILAKSLAAFAEWGSSLSGKWRRTADPLSGGTLAAKLIAVHEQPPPPKGPEKPPLFQP